MDVWLITVGEPLPIDGNDQRLLRTGIVAEILADEGHNVVWWSSTVDHNRKKLRFGSDDCVKLRSNYEIRLLHGILYEKSVSGKRLVNHYMLAKRFSSVSEALPAPDIILCSLPTIELSVAAVRYGLAHGVPVVLDLRDMWPDIFIERVPKWARGLGRLALLGLHRGRNYACRNSVALIGITNGFVEWGLRSGGRERNDLDKSFPLAYKSEEPPIALVAEAEAFWRQLGVQKDNGDFVAVFVGTIRRQIDLRTIIEAACILGAPFKFVLCGTGDDYEYCKSLAGDCKNVLLPGWVNAAQIWTLMRMSSVALAPYKSTTDFMMSIPNKPIEYLSAGLPVISSLKGELETLLSSRGCGLTYEEQKTDQLVDMLGLLKSKPEMLASMSLNARSVYREKFVAENVYRELVSHLKTVSSRYGMEA